MRPIIGISAAWSFETWPKSQLNKDTPNFFYVGSDYVNAIYALGGIPLLINPAVKDAMDFKEISNIISRIDGLLLSGGGDIGINPSDGYIPYLKDQQPKRYRFESMLIKEAWKHDLPTIGICRGHQMIAEVFGGEISDKPIPHHSSKDGLKSWDTLEILPDTLLQKVVQSEKWQVNSYHTQVVTQLPSRFAVSANSQSDQVVEAIEAMNKTFFIGVQFHPEKIFSEDEKSSKLLTYFIDQAKTYERR